MLDQLQLVLFVATFLGGAMMASSQFRYRWRYVELHLPDGSPPSRRPSALKIMVAMMQGTTGEVLAGYSTVQTDPELERLRGTFRWWLRITFGGFVLFRVLFAIRLLTGLS